MFHKLFKNWISNKAEKRIWNKEQCKLDFFVLIVGVLYFSTIWLEIWISNWFVRFWSLTTYHKFKFDPTRHHIGHPFSRSTKDNSRLKCVFMWQFPMVGGFHRRLIHAFILLSCFCTVFKHIFGFPLTVQL